MPALHFLLPRHIIYNDYWAAPKVLLIETRNGGHEVQEGGDEEGSSKVINGFILV